MIQKVWKNPKGMRTHTRNPEKLKMQIYLIRIEMGTIKKKTWKKENKMFMGDRGIAMIKTDECIFHLFTTLFRILRWYFY